MEENEKITNTSAAMKTLLLALADGKMKCDVDLPNFGIVKARIISVDFTNIVWKPVKIHFLEKLKCEKDEVVDNTWSEGQHLEKKWRDYPEDWINVNWIKNYYE